MYTFVITRHINTCACEEAKVRLSTSSLIQARFCVLGSLVLGNAHMTRTWHAGAMLDCGLEWI